MLNHQPDMDRITPKRHSCRALRALKAHCIVSNSSFTCHFWQLLKPGFEVDWPAEPGTEVSGSDPRLRWRSDIREGCGAGGSTKLLLLSSFYSFYLHLMWCSCRLEVIIAPQEQSMKSIEALSSHSAHVKKGVTRAGIATIPGLGPESWS